MNDKIKEVKEKLKLETAIDEVYHVTITLNKKIYDAIADIANREVRTVEQQLLFFVSKIIFAKTDNVQAPPLHFNSGHNTNTLENITPANREQWEALQRIDPNVQAMTNILNAGVEDVRASNRSSRIKAIQNIQDDTALLSAEEKRALGIY